MFGAAVLVLAVLVGAGVAVVVSAAPEPVDAAVGDLAGWRGAKYRGTIIDASGLTTAVAMTVLSDGRAYGSFDRPSGARAQLVVNGDESLVKGNREWWRSVGDAEPGSRADLWVASPPGYPTGLASVARLTPAGLQRDLTSLADDGWRRTGERVVDDQPGEIWSDGTREVVIGVDSGQRVLSVKFPISSGVPGADRPTDPHALEEEGDAPHASMAQLSLTPSDAGEVEALEELIGNMNDLVDMAREALEKSEEGEEAQRDGQSENC